MQKGNTYITQILVFCLLFGKKKVSPVVDLMSLRVSQWWTNRFMKSLVRFFGIRMQAQRHKAGYRPACKNIKTTLIRVILLIKLDSNWHERRKLVLDIYIAAGGPDVSGNGWLVGWSSSQTSEPSLSWTIVGPPTINTTPLRAGCVLYTWMTIVVSDISWKVFLRASGEVWWTHGFLSVINPKNISLKINFVTY